MIQLYELDEGLRNVTREIVSASTDWHYVCNLYLGLLRLICIA